MKITYRNKRIEMRKNSVCIFDETEKEIGKFLDVDAAKDYIDHISFQESDEEVIIKSPSTINIYSIDTSGRTRNTANPIMAIPLTDRNIKIVEQYLKDIKEAMEIITRANMLLNQASTIQERDMTLCVDIGGVRGGVIVKSEFIPKEGL